MAGLKTQEHSSVGFAVISMTYQCRRFSDYTDGDAATAWKIRLEKTLKKKITQWLLCFLLWLLLLLFQLMWHLSLRRILQRDVSQAPAWTVTALWWHHCWQSTPRGDHRPWEYICGKLLSVGVHSKRKISWFNSVNSIIFLLIFFSSLHIWSDASKLIWASNLSVHIQHVSLLPCHMPNTVFI